MIKSLLIGSAAVSGLYGISKVVKRICYPMHFKNKEKFMNMVPFKELCKTAALSRLAYAEPQDILKQADGYASVSGLCNGHEPWWFIDGNPYEDAQVYLWHNIQERKVYVAFRGTEDIRDGLVDLDVRRIAISENIMVHNGFYRQFQSVANLMEKRLEELKKDFDTIVFCGHSLGGGLATIAAAYFGHKGYAVKCCTFGSPRVGNMDFKDCFEQGVSESWRVFNENDPVPMVPISHRFVHVNGGLCINDSENVAVVAEDAPWYLRPFVSSIDYSNIICDHDCKLYISRLETQKIIDVNNNVHC